MFRTFISLMGALALSSAAGAQDRPQEKPQDWPQRPVRLVVGIAPGGLPDIVARLLAKQLTVRLDQAFVVENRAGAGGNIAAKVVAAAPGDGYSLLVTGNNHAVNPTLLPDPGFDYVKDFAPVAVIAGTRMMLVAHPSVKADDVAGLLALAKRDPQSLNFAIAPIGTPGHLAAELFVQMSGVDITLVPYTGIGAAIPDLLAGRVQLAFGAISAVNQFVAGNALKALAISSPTRVPFAPSVPTVSESGLPGFDVDGWLCLMAPAATPKALVDRINKAVIDAVSAPEVTQNFDKQGILQSKPLPPAGVADYIHAESEKWAGVLKKAKAK